MDWKGTPVIGGKVGGIRYQIQDGENGFLVSGVKEAADRIVQVLKHGRLHLDLFNGLETIYPLRVSPGGAGATKG